MPKLHDDLVDGQAVAGCDGDLADHRAFFGLEDVFHLHGLDDGERLARLDRIALVDGDGDDEAGHGAEQQVRGIGRLLLRHQGREFGDARGIDADVEIDAVVAEIEAAGDGADLEDERAIVELHLGQRVARRPAGIDDAAARAIEMDRK